MKRFLGGKSFVILLGGVAILAVVYIAAGLSSFKFKPAELFVINQAPTPTPLSAPVVWQALPLETFLVWAALVLLLLSGLFALLDKEQRKKLLIALLRISILAAVVLFVFSRLNMIPPPVVNEKTDQAPFPGQLPPGPATSTEPFTPPHIPSWGVYFITLLLLLGIAAGIWLLLRRNRVNPPALPLDELASIARTTLDDIRTGRDWEDSVVQCYVRMSATVSRRRDLARPVAVTPTEFALQLENAGLPGPAVHQLTTLFEQVRYGAKPSTEHDMQSAVDCLTTILHACGEAL
ncbi:MAG: DUF4129 domain-containing protein [Anaerolineales bacterium]|jgi:multisubunit Na+/H+ antiporter MnhC subunit